MTIVDEYLYYHNKYTEQYGSKTFVLMQVGSFFESYATDDEGYNLNEISYLLNIIVTQKGKGNKVTRKHPYMLGIPLVSLDKYLRVLMENGYTVPLFEQSDNDNTSRKLSIIYSPGTYINNISPNESNNIVCIYIEDELQRDTTYVICMGITVIDVTTGVNTVYEVLSTVKDNTLASDEAVRFINSYNPKEIIVYRKKTKNENKTKHYLSKEKLLLYLELDNKSYNYSERIDKSFYKLSYQEKYLTDLYNNKSFTDNPILELGFERMTYGLIGYILTIEYIYKHNETIIRNIKKPNIYVPDDHLILGNNALFQLSVFRNNSIDYGVSKIKSLFDVINNTSTAIGRRFLKERLINPILDIDKLNATYDKTELMMENNLYEDIEKKLNGIVDIERLYRRVTLQQIHPFELANLYDGLLCVKEINSLLKKKVNISLQKNNILKLKQFIKEYKNTYDLEKIKLFKINDINESFFKSGVCKDIDLLQNQKNEYINFMNTTAEKITECINNSISKTKKGKKIKISDSIAKVDKNNKHGYHISLTKIKGDIFKKELNDNVKIKINKNVTLTKKNIIFKQLDKGKTKIFFSEIEEISNKLDSVETEISDKIKELYLEKLNEYTKNYSETFSHICNYIGLVDFLKSNAKTAKKHNYCKPIIKEHSNSYIKCKNVRHPIIENIIDTEYIPHSVSLGSFKKNTLDGMLIYGLNSAGKSVFMKSIGLSVIMAQCGMFVPAEKYEFSPYKSLYARITGNDNIFKGLSSFALEMTELKAILSRSDKNTLVIGDEICRGTEHISGNSIVASSIIQLSKAKASFIFATHLHEIPEIKEVKNLSNVKPFHLTVEHDKENDMLVFDRKLKDGSGDSIYGITVAKYIINDSEFMNIATSIRNSLLNKNDTMVPTKTSRYNKDVYMDKCHNCGYKVKSPNEYLDTHHINFQKDCTDGFVNDKKHMKMNSKANLVPLCKKCHQDIDKHNITISGYKKTSKGKKLIKK